KQALKLSVRDIVTMMRSSDVSARSLGIVFLTDHIASSVGGSGAFKMGEGTLKQTMAMFNKAAHSESVLEDIITHGGLAAITESMIRFGDDPELRLFATYAITDLCCFSNVELRW